MPESAPGRSTLAPTLFDSAREDRRLTQERWLEFRETPDEVHAAVPHREHVARPGDDIADEDVLSNAVEAKASFVVGSRREEVEVLLEPRERVVQIVEGLVRDTPPSTLDREGFDVFDVGECSFREMEPAHRAFPRRPRRAASMARRSPVYSCVRPSRTSV